MLAISGLQPFLWFHINLKFLMGRMYAVTATEFQVSAQCVHFYVTEGYH